MQPKAGVGIRSSSLIILFIGIVWLTPPNTLFLHVNKRCYLKSTQFSNLTKFQQLPILNSKSWPKKLISLDGLLPEIPLRHSFLIQMLTNKDTANENALKLANKIFGDVLQTCSLAFTFIYVYFTKTKWSIGNESTSTSPCNLSGSNSH